MVIKLVDSHESLIGLIESIKSFRTGFETNFYLNQDKCHNIIELRKLFFLECDECVFLIRENNLFYNVYYIATSTTSLSNGIGELKLFYGQNTLIVDIVSKTYDNIIVKLFQDNGFDLISTLNRMYKLNNRETISNPRSINANNVRFANRFDLNEIKNKLDSNFNKEVEQLPDNLELEKLIENESVLVHEIKNELNGFLIFQKIGKIINLNYWYVDVEKRDLKIGSQLFERFLIEGQDCLKFQLWVITNNQNAIKKYLHYGFQEENTHNFVLKKYETTNN